MPMKSIAGLLAAGLILAVAPSVEASGRVAWAQAATKQVRAKKAKSPARSIVRAPRPAAPQRPAPASIPAEDLSTRGGGGGGGY
jgi:hypothetical protein